MRLFSFEKLPNWPKKVKQQQVSCEKITSVTNENDSSTTSWISSIFRKVCCIQKKEPEGPTDNDDNSNNNNEKGTLHHVTDSGDTSLKHKNGSPVNSSVTSSSTYKQIVSLSSFLEETTHTTIDRHDLRYRHLTQPFKPMYEVEWQKDQWLPLDRCTNQQIERLRKKGFSKALVRKDPMLMKEFTHDEEEPNILLELCFLHQQQDTSFIQQQNNQQDTSFSVRRVRWWHTSQVGCANVSDSIELPSFPSQQGGLNPLFKSLHYSEPPYFMQHSSLSA